MQRGAVKLQYVVMDEQIDDVLTKPLAIVKLSTSWRSLVFIRSRFLPRGSAESVGLSDMVVGVTYHACEG